MKKIKNKENAKESREKVLSRLLNLENRYNGLVFLYQETEKSMTSLKKQKLSLEDRMLALEHKVLGYQKENTDLERQLISLQEKWNNKFPPARIRTEEELKSQKEARIGMWEQGIAQTKEILKGIPASDKYNTELYNKTLKWLEGHLVEAKKGE